MRAEHGFGREIDLDLVMRLLKLFLFTVRLTLVRLVGLLELLELLLHLDPGPLLLLQLIAERLFLLLDRLEPRRLEKSG